MQRVSVGELKNGLRFYAHYDRVAHVGGIGVKCGSIHDPPGKQGMAHLVEHVITQRTRELDHMRTQLLFWKFMGGFDKNRMIQTDRVSTFYGNDTLLREYYMMQCFKVFASMLRDPVVTTEDILAEKAAVLQEYFLRGIDLLPTLIDDLMHESMYQKNPARNRIDCDPQELQTISPEDIKKFMEDYYGPNNLFIILLGPSHEKAKQLAERYFGDLPPRAVPALGYDHSEDYPHLSSVKSVMVPRVGISQFHVALGFPTETYKSKDAEAIEVLAQILNLRLYFRLRMQNLDSKKGVYRVEVFTPRTFVHGIIYIYFATSDADFAEWGRKMVLEEIEKINKNPVSGEEIDAVRSRLDAEYLEAFRDTPSDLADLIIEAVANGDENLEDMHAYRKRLYKVSPRKIQRIAGKYLVPNFVDLSLVPA